MTYLAELFQANAWIINLCTIILTAIALTLVVHYLFIMSRQRISRINNIWFESAIRAAKAPLLILIWIFSAVHVFFSINFNFTTSELDLPMVRRFILIVGILWYLLNFITHLENRALHKISLGVMRSDKTSVIAIAQLSRAIVIVSLILVTLQNFGISISALLAFGGVGGLAVGFAAKDTLANFLGGLMIFLDRPFSVGEDIRCTDQHIEGTVEHIGWRLTQIRDPESRTLYVPNGLFSTMVLENISRIRGWRIKFHVALKMESIDKIPPIVDEIKQYLKTHPEIDPNQAIAVSLDEIGSYSLNILVLAFTKTVKWLEYIAVHQTVLLKVTEIVNQHNGQLALPVQINYLKPSKDNKGDDNSQTPT